MSKEEKEKTVKRDAVPYIVYEGTQARNERTIKRLIIALIVSICLIFVSNMAWLWYLSGYDFETYEYTQDGGGTNILGDGNGVSYYEPAPGGQSTPEEKPEKS